MSCGEQPEANFKKAVAGIGEAAGHIFTGAPPHGAFYAFVRINPEFAKEAGITGPSLSWAMAEHLIKHGRIGCVPGADFGPSGEGYIRFAIGKSRNELEGALKAMRAVFAAAPARTQN